MYNISKDKRLAAATTTLASILDFKVDPISGLRLYEPKKFENQILSEEKAQKFIKQGNIWFYKDEFKDIKDKFKMAAEDLVDIITDERGA